MRKRKKQVNAPVGSATFERRMERQRARRKVDREGVDKNKNGKADKREGKDVSHKKALVKGGKNKDGIRIESSSKNRARNYKKKKYFLIDFKKKIKNSIGKAITSKNSRRLSQKEIDRLLSLNYSS